jgi:protoporphyrinogen oxidase
MNADIKNIVITGSGLSALLLARAIREYRNKRDPIHIVERDATVGGQFGSIDYGDKGLFDYGMHIYYENCRPEIDSLFTSILPEEEWNILEDNEKDIAGIYYNGRLQTNTPYPDLRFISPEERKKIIAELMLHIEQAAGKSDGGESAGDVLYGHFGSYVVDRIFAPILKKLYERKPDDLDQIATSLTTINRVALFGAEVMKDLMQSPAIRARICYPDQLTMPPYRTTTQRAFYPRKFGMRRVCEALKARLESENVKFLTSTTVTSVVREGDEITALHLKTGSEEFTIGNIGMLYWSAGLPPLAGLLKIDVSDLKYDKNVNTAFYVNILFSKPPKMDRLYYFYCFDAGFRVFRVTNYTNYCPQASEGRGYPLCVEMWMREGDDLEPASVVDKSLSELKKFGVIDESNTVVFSDAYRQTAGGFPLPTVTNVRNVNIIRERVAALNLKNVAPIGVFADKNVFFIKDVLLHMYRVAIEEPALRGAGMAARG